MTNGHLDFGLILFQLGQYLLVFISGYFMVRGFLDWLTTFNLTKVQSDIKYWDKKIELEKIKSVYADMVKPEPIELEVEEEVETEEVEIPSLDECLKKDPNFLEHGEILPEPGKNVGQQNMHPDSNHNNSHISTLKGSKPEPKKIEKKKRGLIRFFSSHRK